MAFTNKEHARQYYCANRERIIAQQIAYQKRHPEVVKAASRRYYLKNAEKLKVRVVNRAARKASVFRDAFIGEC